MDEPLDHVLRPVPPWRPESTLTECGRQADGTLLVITRDAFTAKLKRQGRSRTSLTTCMTCWKTATRWRTWLEDPVDAMRRETSFHSASEAELRFELRALELLVLQHADEFDALLAGLQQTVSLADARRRRAQGGGRHG